MFSQSERKLARLNAYEGTEITENVYNLMIGLMLLYGLLVNCFVVDHVPEFVYYMSPLVFFLLYFGCVIAGSILVSRPKPILSFIGYTLIVLPLGLVLAMIIPGFPVDIVKKAFLLTAVITGGMVIVSTMFPRAFLSIGRGLGISLLIFIIVEAIAAIFFHAAPGIFDAVGVGIFTLYVGYDWAKAQAYPKTVDNAIDSACDIYLDIINIFIRLLSILSRSKDK